MDEILSNRELFILILNKLDTKYVYTHIYLDLIMINKGSLYHEQQKLNEIKVSQFKEFHQGKNFCSFALIVLKVLKKAIAQRVC